MELSPMGEAAGDSLTSLLKAHINGAVPILVAVKTLLLSHSSN